MRRRPARTRTEFSVGASLFLAEDQDAAVRVGAAPRKARSGLLALMTPCLDAAGLTAEALAMHKIPTAWRLRSRDHRVLKIAADTATAMARQREMPDAKGPSFCWGLDSEPTCQVGLTRDSA